jgi:hypothetical protein
MLEARRKVGPEVNKETTKYIIVFCQQNERQNHNLILCKCGKFQIFGNGSNKSKLQSHILLKVD